VSKKSDQHQEILKYLVFLLIGLLIASIGYHQLYSPRPTFGANVWIEYFSLFIWGFCAEVSLSPIIQLIRK
jgi:fatty-acid desaturase